MNNFAAASRLRRPGLDQLRLVAASLIFLQHSFSACHLDEWIDVAGFRIGRIGTSLFFMLAGYFASASSRSPGQWLNDRLAQLFPAFWLLTLAGFLVAAVTGFKPFDTFQVACQLAGIGYLTHGERMVNVATWFMTPLLFLYLTAFVSRRVGAAPMSLLLCFAFAVAALILNDHAAVVMCHAATFQAAFLLGTTSLTHQKSRAVQLSVALGVLTVFQPEFRYATVSMLGFALMSACWYRLLLAERFTRVAYEWFLVHSLCLTLVVRWTQWPWLVIALGIPISAVAAIVLKTTVKMLKSLRLRLAAATRSHLPGLSDGSAGILPSQDLAEIIVGNTLPASGNCVISAVDVPAVSTPSDIPASAAASTAACV